MEKKASRSMNPFKRKHVPVEDEPAPGTSLGEAKSPTDIPTDNVDGPHVAKSTEANA